MWVGLGCEHWPQRMQVAIYSLVLTRMINAGMVVLPVSLLAAVVDALLAQGQVFFVRGARGTTVDTTGLSPELVLESQRTLMRGEVSRVGLTFFLEDHGGEDFFVLFHSEHSCASCKSALSQVKELAYMRERMADYTVFLEVDCEVERLLCRGLFGVSRLPSLYLYDGISKVKVMGAAANINEMEVFLDAHEANYKQGRFDTMRYYLLQFFRFAFTLSGAESADTSQFYITLALMVLSFTSVAVLPSGIACAVCLQRRQRKSKILAKQLKPNLEKDSARFLLTVPETFKPGKPTTICCRGIKFPVTLPEYAKPGETVIVSIPRKELLERKKTRVRMKLAPPDRGTPQREGHAAREKT